MEMTFKLTFLTHRISALNGRLKGVAQKRKFRRFNRWLSKTGSRTCKKSVYSQASESNTASTVSSALIEKRLWTVDRVPPVLMSPRRKNCSTRRGGGGTVRLRHSIRRGPGDRWAVARASHEQGLLD